MSNGHVIKINIGSPGNNFKYLIYFHVSIITKPYLSDQFS